MSKKRVHSIPWVQSLAGVVIIFGALAGLMFYQANAGTIEIENSTLDAPVITIAPTSPGTLNALYVKEGDHIDAQHPVAVVGTETLYAQEAGIVLDAPRALGSYYAPGQKVLSIIADQKMRVVGTIDETKGLNEIKPNQPVIFTVDAYPGKQYRGAVDSISPASDDAGVLFSISDKRPVKKFDVYIRFDPSQYPELRSGMSAKSWVYLR